MATGGGPSIEEEEQQNFTRIQIALSDCGIAVIKELFLQRVRDLSPRNQPNGCWTVDEFLNENMNTIMRSIGNDKHKKSIVYPFGQKTDLDKWDIRLFALVLLASCDISAAGGTLRHDITNLCNLSNKMCYIHPKLSAVIYNGYLGRVRGLINRICVFLNNQTLTEFVNETLDKYESLTHAYPNGMSKEHLKNIDIVSEDDLSVTGALEQIEQLINETGAQIQIPVIEVVLLLRHYNREDEERVSNYLRESFANAIHQTSLQEEASQDPDREERGEKGDRDRDVADTINHLVKELFREKRGVSYAKQSCVILGIQVPDIGSAITLIDDVISGRMCSLFAPLEEMMRTQKGHQLFDICVTMERKTTYTFLNEIVSQITSSRSLNKKMTLSVKQDGECTDAVSCVYHPSSYIVRRQVINDLTSEGKSELYQTTVDEIRRILEIPKLEMKVFFDDTSCPKSVVLSVDKTFPVKQRKLTWPGRALRIFKALPIWKAIGLDFKVDRSQKVAENIKTPVNIKQEITEKAIQARSLETTENPYAKMAKSRKKTEHIETVVNIKDETAEKAEKARETTGAPTFKYVSEMELLGTEGHGEDGNITGIAIIGDRFLVGADFKNECVRCFNMDSGKQQVKWQGSGFLPWRITTIPGNRVAVISTNEVWFLRVTEKGELLFENKINVKKHCFGIASSGDNLIVGDYLGVYILDMNGHVIKAFEKNDYGGKLFEWPTSMALSPDHSTIYIIDKAKQTVTALTKDGCVLGVVDIKVRLPFGSGITVDSAGRVYVCGFDIVFLLSIETGTVTPLLGIKGVKTHLSFVAVCDKTQRLHVSSLNSNVIQVFEMPKHTTA